MIGTRIESSPSLPVSAIILGAGWVISVVLALVSRNVHVAIGGLPLACFAAARLLARERPLRLEVEHEGLNLVDTHQTIPYASIRSLSPASHSAEQTQFAIDVCHAEGRLTIPASIDHSSKTLDAFLRSRLVPQPQGFVHPALQNHLREEQELFGAEKVFCFSPRERLDPPRRGSTLRGIGLGMLATGILWGLSGVFSELWIIPGIILGLFGGIFFLASYARRSTVDRIVKNGHESTLLVTPTGIALMQGNLKGKLRWDEVHAVKMTGPASFSLTPVVSGLTIQIAGSQITIMDIYDEGLPVIQQRINAYFSGEAE